MNPRPVPTLLKLIFGCVAAVLILVAGGLLYSELSFGRRAMKAEGVVVALESRRGSKGGTTYAPVVEFDVNWEKIRFTSSTSSSPASFDVGEKVEVLYEPGNPQEAAINSFFSRFLGVLIVGIMAIVFSLVAVGLWFAKSKR